MMTRKGVESRIKKRVNKFLLEKEFVIDKYDCYLLKKGNYTLDVTFGVNTVSDIKGNFVIGYGFGLRFNEIEEIWEKYRVILGEERQPLGSTMGFGRAILNPSFDKYPEHRFAKGGGVFVKEEEDIYIYIENFKKEYDELIIPFIEKVKQIKWIDSIVNPNIENTASKTPYFPNTGFWYKRIIIAKLANNPNYEEIYEWVRHRFQKGYEDTGNEKYKNIVTVLDKVYEDLKNLNPTT